jgi:hypothetical protein
MRLCNVNERRSTRPLPFGESKDESLRGEDGTKRVMFYDVIRNAESHRDTKW